ncbi:MAG TPA: HD domain-containing protein [Candidatus Woesebacteria bacterium]|nr:HD domain-containing protein [Candidatus Woesebacteria bacterium]
MKLPEYIQNFMKTFETAGFKMYVVGGTVRGLLMNRKIEDWDFTTNAKPEEIMELFPHSFYENTFGTVGIPEEINGKPQVFEVTTFRKESGYSNTRHPDKVEWASNVEEDLARRDFTMNAIAYDGKEYVDPYGGQKDIDTKLIRAVGDPDIRFSEDALRLMRAIRQSSQLQFQIEEKTLASIKKNADLIKHISWERIRDEFFKILESDFPADGMYLLKETGILQYILPEVTDCFSIDQVSPERHHIYDVGTHLVESLRHCPSSDAITRFATLIHDIGKKQTYRKDHKTGIITFYNHEVVGANQAEEIANRFRLSNKQKEKLVKLVRLHQFTVSEEQSDKAIRRFIREVGVEHIEDMLALRTGDRLGSGSAETSWRTELFKKRIEEVQVVPFSIKDLKIDGNDVMKELGIKPGPEIGKILDAIFEEVDEGKLQNTREMLLNKLNDFKKDQS